MRRMSFVPWRIKIGIFPNFILNYGCDFVHYGAPPFELKRASSAFFLARSSIRRASLEENTNLTRFNFEWILAKIAPARRFFLARSSIRRASLEENTNLTRFNFEWILAKIAPARRFFLLV